PVPFQLLRDIGEHGPHAIVLGQGSLGCLELDAGSERGRRNPPRGLLARSRAVQDYESPRHQNGTSSSMTSVELKPCSTISVVNRSAPCWSVHFRVWIWP